MPSIDSFAKEHRLKVIRDECGGQIIQGRRGHIHMDGRALCVMVTDGLPANLKSWKELGGTLWMGDISPDKRGKRVQDVKVYGVENAKAAIKMVRAKKKRVVSAEEHARLAQMAKDRPKLTQAGTLTAKAASKAAGGSKTPPKRK